jgi:hypothetical protein
MIWLSSGSGSIPARQRKRDRRCKTSPLSSVATGCFVSPVHTNQTPRRPPPPTPLRRRRIHHSYRQGSHEMNTSGAEVRYTSRGATGKPRADSRHTRHTKTKRNRGYNRGYRDVREYSRIRIVWLQILYITGMMLTFTARGYTYILPSASLSFLFFYLESPCFHVCLGSCAAM